MKRKTNVLTGVVLLLVSVVAVGMMSSCNDKKASNSIVEHLKPVPEALLPFLNSYTSGVITPGEPIRVSFKDADELKLKYGEALPSKLFEFTPSLKGKAIWIDNNTVGFQYDKIDDAKQYVCSFKAAELLDVPSDMTLDFGFAVRRQNFSLVSVIPNYGPNDEVAFHLQVAFSNPVDAEQVLSVFEHNFVSKYGVTATALGNNLFDIQINNVQRGDKESTIQIVMNGKSLNCKTVIEDLLPVCAKGDFEPVLFDVEKGAAHAVLYFSEPLKPNQNLDGFITFEPQIGYRADIKDNRIDFYFDKTGLNSYQLEEMNMLVHAGLRNANNVALPDDASYNFDLTEDLPLVRWTCEGNIIPDVNETTVYFDAVCLNSVTLRIIRIFDENILGFLQDNDLDETYGVRKAGRLEKKVRLEIDNPNPTQWKTFPIVLSDYITVEKGGMYQLSLDFGPQDYVFATDEMKAAVTENEMREAAYWDGQAYDYKEYNYDGDWNDPYGFYYYNYKEIKKNIVVSDLAITAKMGRDDWADVFVYHISDAKPVQGATVKAYNFQRQELVSAATDAQGHVSLSCANRPAFIVATDNNGSRSVIKTMDGNSLSYSKFDVGGEAVEKGIAAFAYTNRGVWRPGDELQLNLMLSDLDAQIPDNYPVVLEVYDASARLYAKQSKSNAVNGVYCFNIPTLPSDETGLWTAKFKVGTTVITKTLRVETVKPNRLEIVMDTPDVVSINNSETVTLTSKWLNGMKASGLKAEVDAKVRKGTTSFKNFADYTFVNETESFYPEEISVYSGSLSGDGSARVGFAPFKDISSSQMLDATFTIKVFEQSGDFSITSQRVKLSPCANYIGVALPETQSKYGSYYDTGKDWQFNVAVVRENGSLNQSTIPLDYALYKLDSYWWWSSEDSYDLQRYASGTYKRPVQNGTLSCNGKTSLIFNIPDDKWGNYLLVVDDPTSNSRFAKVICFDWGSGAIHSNSASGAPAQLSMCATKDTYNVGENIVVNFPANEQAKALVTVEANDKVMQNMYLDKLGTEGKVEIKATEEMIPNVYVYVALIQPHDAENDMPVRMYGVVPVKVENKDLELKPTVSVPETSNTNKTVNVKVGESNGKAMTYTLAVVDEGILGLTNFATPNPYRYFNSKQSLEVRTWDNYASVIDAFSGELGSVYAIGGDGVINQEITLDNRFKAYAVTLGPFELKAGATNNHEFVVPQCSGALRFMVVAKSGEKSFGSSEKQIKVIDPITLYPAAPRVAAPGDELTLKLQVLSPVLKGKTLNVKVENKNLTSVGALPTSVSIDNNGEGMIAMNVKVDDVLDNAVMKVIVSQGNYSAESTTEIPIRMPYAERRNVITREIEANASLDVPVAVEGMRGTQSGKILLSNMVPVDLFSRLDFLTSYPHGCLEQITSKAFPQLYLNYFVQQSDDDIAKMKANVEAVIADLRSYQKSDNSLTNWVGGTYVDPWTEIYALHFLVEAQKQGFAVPEYFTDGLLKYQGEKAKKWNNNPDFKQGETIQAYRLFVLALAGKSEMGAMNRFKELELNYSLSKALIAAAFAQVGKATVAQNILPQVTEGERMSDYYTSFGSVTRDLAFVTYAQMLCGRDKEAVQGNINELCGILNSDQWLDTQSTAFALFVLGKYAEVNNLTNANLSAVVTVNGEEKTLNSNLASVGLDFVPNIGNNSVKIKNNSDQKIVASLFTKSSVAEYETTENGNFIRMKVNYFDKSGKPINVTSMQQGTDFVVEMTVENPSEYQVTELALSYYLASGWEIVNDRLIGDGSGNEGAKHIDLRDDRAYFYFDLMPKTKKTFTLKLNATYEGNYMIPAVRCEDMYNAAIYYVIPARGCVVK